MKCCVSLMPNAMWLEPSKTLNFCLVKPNFPKSFENHQNTPDLCSFWSAVAFTLELSHGCHFCQLFFPVVESWTLTWTETSDSCLRQVILESSWNVLVSFMTSWISLSALWVILVAQLLLRMFTAVLGFLHLWIILSPWCTGIPNP